MSKRNRSRAQALKRKSRYGNPATQADYTAATVPERYPSGYRMSDQFINVISTILGVSMLVLVGIGFLLGLVFGNSGDWVATTAITLILTGIGLPFLIAAWLGGQALHRFGGPVGLLLTAGFAGVVYGKTAHQPVFTYAGFAATALSIIIFWLLGRKAGVRMFFGPRHF